MKRIDIGSLGRFDILPGFYAYVGSAFGAGGLRARIGHHLESTAWPHWHIDYLLGIAEPGAPHIVSRRIRGIDPGGQSGAPFGPSHESDLGRQLAQVLVVPWRHEARKAQKPTSTMGHSD